jgi:hypothetical protein
MNFTRVERLIYSIAGPMGCNTHPSIYLHSTTSKSDIIYPDNALAGVIERERATCRPRRHYSLDVAYVEPFAMKYRDRRRQHDEAASRRYPGFVEGPRYDVSRR